MAFNDNTDLRHVISMETTDRLSQQTLMTGLTNRDWQMEAETPPYPSYIEIHTFDSQRNFDAITNTDIASYNSKLTWDDAIEDSSTNVKLYVNRAARGSRFMGWRDLNQLPLNLRQQEVQSLANQMTKRLDRQCVLDWIGTGASGSLGVDTENDDATDGITVAGDATNYINASGIPQGTGMAKQLYDWVRDFMNYADDTDFGFASTTQRFAWMMMPGRLIDVLLEYIVDNKTNGGSMLSDSILGNNGLRMLGGGAMRRSKGRLYSIELLSANDLIPDATISTKAHWQILAGTSSAFAFVTQPMLTQNLSAMDNQVGTGNPDDKVEFQRPGGLLRTIMPFGGVMVDRRQARLYRMRKQA